MTNPIDMPWPGSFQPRITRVKAWRVSHANLQQVAEWVGGHTWAATVILPGDRVANVGDWIVHAGETFTIAEHGRFVRDFVPVVTS